MFSNSVGEADKRSEAELCIIDKEFMARMARDLWREILQFNQKTITI